MIRPDHIISTTMRQFRRSITTALILGWFVGVITAVVPLVASAARVWPR